MIEEYLSREKIHNLTGWKRERIRQFIRGIQASGRYPPEDIIEDGHLILIHESIVLDWLRNRKKIKRGDLVPPYKRGR